MATQPLETGYVVVVWDYDAAPDAAEYFSRDYTEEQERESILPYYCSKRWKTPSLRDAIDVAKYEVQEKFACGAAVFQGEKEVFGIGMVFPYKERYL